MGEIASSLVLHAACALICRRGCVLSASVVERDMSCICVYKNTRIGASPFTCVCTEVRDGLWQCVPSQVVRFTKTKADV